MSGCAGVMGDGPCAGAGPVDYGIDVGQPKGSVIRLVELSDSRSGEGVGRQSNFVGKQSFCADGRHR